MNRWFDKNVGPSTDGTPRTRLTPGQPRRARTCVRYRDGGGHAAADAVRRRRAPPQRRRTDRSHRARRLVVGRHRARWLLGADTLLDDLIERRRMEAGPPAHVRAHRHDPRLSHHYARGDVLPHPALRRSASTRHAARRPTSTAPGATTTATATTASPWHADRELHATSTTRGIAIVTLGTRRPFLLRGRQTAASRATSRPRRATCS